jgi:rubrerythrin
MSVVFNVEEIFDLAIQIEKNGAKFYKKTAEFADDPGTKETLDNLAEMEKEHEDRFKKLKDELVKPGTAQTVFDPYDELALYLKAFADGHVFDLSDPTQSISGKEDQMIVLRKAIGFEKDSIVFYLGMKELVPGDSEKDKIDTIIKEEMGHIQLLSTRIRSMNK